VIAATYRVSQTRDSLEHLFFIIHLSLVKTAGRAWLACVCLWATTSSSTRVRFRAPHFSHHLQPLEFAAVVAAVRICHAICWRNFSWLPRPQQLACFSLMRRHLSSAVSTSFYHFPRVFPFPYLFFTLLFVLLADSDFDISRAFVCYASLASSIDSAGKVNISLYFYFFFLHI